MKEKAIQNAQHQLKVAAGVFRALAKKFQSDSDKLHGTRCMLMQSNDAPKDVEPMATLIARACECEDSIRELQETLL